MRFVSILTLLPLALVACSSQDLAEREPNGALSQEAAEYRKQRISDLSYKLDISLDASAENYRGQVEIAFRYRGGGEPLTVDFRDGEVLALQLDGQPLAYDYNGHFISLPGGVLTAGDHVLTITYSHPYSQDGSGLYRYRDPEDGRVYLYTDFEPYNANRLLPLFDQPDLKARYQLTVRAPAAWHVISAAPPRGEPMHSGNTRVWEFPQTLPISSYVLPLHAGEYAVWEDRDFRYPLRLFARHSMAPYVDQEQWFRVTRQGFDFFDEYFDFPYPFQKYDQVIVPDLLFGAMENIAAVTFNEGFLVRGKATRLDRLDTASVIMHEMAHMWFGNISTMAWWNGLWLNESFATYLASLALASNTEFTESWLDFFLWAKRSAYSQDQLVTTHPIEVPVATTEDAFANFDGITYGKGASVLRQLSTRLSDDVFRAGVRAYTRANAWQNTELEDFIQAMEDASGLNLKHWVQQWLREAGLNTLQVRQNCTDGVIDSLHLVQEAPPSHPILREQAASLAFYSLRGEALSLDREIPVLFKGAMTKIPKAKGLPCPDLIYPNYRDLAYVKFLLDDHALETVRNHINSIESPLQRAMLWHDLWWMILDAKLPLSDLLDMIATGLESERDLSVASSLSRYLRQAFAYLQQLPGAAGTLRANAQSFESILWNLIQRSSGDDRRQWLSTYIQVASHDAAWQRLVDMLDGRVRMDGLEEDQELRWQMVLKLSEFQYPDRIRAEALVQTELRRDPGSKGQENAMQAEVLAADLQGKMAWLQKATSTGEGYTLRRSELIARSLFQRPSQRAMMASHADELLGQVFQLAGKHDLSFQDSVVVALLPRLCTAENVRRLKDALGRYDEKDASPVITRALKTAAQWEQRCVAIGDLMLDR